MLTNLRFLFILSLSLLFSCKKELEVKNLPLDENIRLNQLGFTPLQPKIAILTGIAEVEEFVVWDTVNREVVFRGAVEAKKGRTLGGMDARTLDFSEVSHEGIYLLVLPKKGKSYPFKIDKTVYQDAAKAALKAFYFQRASLEIPEEYGGEWARAAGHLDLQVRIHASASSASRPENTLIEASRGWYDAGDYNKYVVNSGITCWTLLSFFEDFPQYAEKLRLEIPEQGGKTPDILDEVRWNLDWMLQMQDPEDGGVYHKLTTSKFEKMETPPGGALQDRYLVQKGTAATLDFAAVMAQAARVFKSFALEESMVYLKASEKAWSWAIHHPEEHYLQNDLNAIYQPAITTGAYGDRDLRDEWIWAASELLITTHNQSYLDKIPTSVSEFTLPTWSKVAWLGYLSLLRHEKNLPQISREWMDELTGKLRDQADLYSANAKASAFHTAMGTEPSDFVWGSNAVAANQGIVAIYAYKLTGEGEYLDLARGNLDYLLGKNATGYCYLTGFGSKSPLHPHHRLVTSMKSPQAIPGFLVGGPNPGQQDSLDYPSSVPDESYLDEYKSYASNEIAINWNAPMAYLLNALNQF